METETLLQQHERFIDKAKSRGDRVLSFNVPCCGKALETHAPQKGDTWDSLTLCPYCGGYFMKIVTYDKAIGRLPERKRHGHG